VKLLNATVAIRADFESAVTAIPSVTSTTISLSSATTGSSSSVSSSVTFTVRVAVFLTSSFTLFTLASNFAVTVIVASPAATALTVTAFSPVFSTVATSVLSEETSIELNVIELDEASFLYSVTSRV